MRGRFLAFFLLAVSALAQPITTLWTLNIPAKGGNTNGREFLLWGESRVYKIDKSGKILWKRFIKNLQRAFLLPDGQAIALTNKGSKQELIFLNLKGYNFWQFSCDKVIAIASKEKKVALITGKGELYIFTLRNSPGRLRGWRRYNFHKPLRTLAFLRDGRIVLAMTEQMCIFEEGKQPLFFPFPKIEKILPLSDGGFLSLILQRDGSIFSRHIHSGYVLWSKEFKGETCSLLSAPPFCSLGVEQRVGKDMEERKLVVLRQDGTICWQRGGLLFKPFPLLLTSQGELLCTDETREKLLLFNNKGRFIWEKKARGKIIHSIPLYPSSALLLYENEVEFVEVKR